MTVRRADNVETLPAESFPKRRTWEQVYGTSLRLVTEPVADYVMEWDQSLLALETGDAFRIDDEAFAGLWYFVTDVNGIEHTVTGKTLVFDCESEQTTTFDLCRPIELEQMHEAIEANQARERLGMEPRSWFPPHPSTASVPYLPAKYQAMLAPRQPTCHGYANCCECRRCMERAEAWAEQQAELHRHVA